MHEIKKFKGKAHLIGDNIDTDVIIPAPYLVTTDPKELAKNAFEGLGFVKKVKDGDVLIAGKNFGCGSSREHAPLAIKGLGFSCVIASSFARIFFRNAVNIGLLILEIPGIEKKASSGDELEVDIIKGLVKNITRNEEYKSQPFPEFMQGIVKAGGLMKYVSKKIKN